MRSNSTLIAGFVLISLGIFLLVREHIYFDAFFFRSYGLILVGIFFALRSFNSERNRGDVFPASFFSLLGTFYLLGDMDVYPLFMEFTVSSWVLIFGLSYFPYFLVAKREPQYFILGTVISAVGFSFAFYALGMIDSVEYLRDYWPIGLIVIGVGYLINGFIKSRKQEDMLAR